MRLIILTLLGIAAPLSAAPFSIGQGKAYHTMAAAVFAIGDGDGVINIAPGRYPDCAVQTAGHIRYRAEKPGTAIFDGGICEGKAVLVLRGRGAIVEGLIFENLRVPDGNGAGIRIEKGPLTVLNSSFRNSEEGILGGGDDPASDILIERSTFSGLGRCDRGLACAHSIYLSAYRSVTVRRSRFERGRGGHYVKSRSPRIEVSDSSFDDSQGRATNYMIDLSDGASGLIQRNIFVQGADKENHVAYIAVAPEGQRHSSANLLVADNRAHPVRSVAWRSALVADWSGSPKRLVRNALGADVYPLLLVKVEPPGFATKVKTRLKSYARRLKERIEL